MLTVFVVVLEREVNLCADVQGRLGQQLAVSPLVVSMVELTPQPQVVALLLALDRAQEQLTIGEVVVANQVDLVRNLAFK